MDVVLLNQYYAPDEAATAQLLADVGSGLAASGHRVRAVASSRCYADPRRRYAARERIDGVEVRRSWCTGFGRGSRAGRILDYLTFAAGAAGALLGVGRADVVLSLSTPPLVALLGLVAARIKGARSVYWVMDVYPDLAFELGALRRGSLAGRLFAAVSGFVLRHSHTVVALGETMGQRLAEAGARNVVVVHNWADGDAIRPRPVPGHALREAWGWSARFVVLYSGNMGLAHEFETVLDAAERLAGDPRVLFAFVGGGPRRGEVEREVRRRGLSNVEFRPYVERERLGDSLTAGDVHLVTLRPGMPGLLVPSKIYGILAAGRPTLYVGPDQGEIAAIVEQGACGTRIETGAGERLAAAVRAYATDPARCAGEGAAGRHLFEQRFRKQHGLSAFVRLIDDAAG